MPSDEEELFRAGAEPAPPPEVVDDHAPLTQPPADRAGMSEAVQALHKPAEPRTSGVPTVKPPGVPGQPDDGGPPSRVPLAELLEERDKRQKIERELEHYRQKAQPQQQPAGYDPEQIFSDPGGFVSLVSQQLEQRIALAELNADLRMTAYQHGDEWNDAWGAYWAHVNQKDPDGRLVNGIDYFRVMQSPSPGQEILNWHREHKWKEDFGDNPQSYQDKLLDDPEFLARVAERLGVAAPAVPERPRAPNGQFRPAPPPRRLPTSLSRAGGTGTHGDDDVAMDGSEDAVWKAGSRKSRR